MRAIGRFLVLATISVLFSACGGGDGKSQQVQIPDPPAAPVVTVSADIKQLIFSWDEVTGVTHHRLLENPDGHSGFTQVGYDIPSNALTVTRQISVHLHDWVNALYLVRACNAGGCTDSTQVNATDLMLDTIGYFKASTAAANDHFGNAIAVSHDGMTLAVGEPGQLYFGNGKVCVFRFGGASWFEEACFTASNVVAGDQFGGAVAVSSDGDTLAVGAYEDNAVYVFRFDGSEWQEEAYIKPPIGGGYFGFSIALAGDGNRLVVGAPFDSSNATGINGDPSDTSLDDAGAAYVFDFDGNAWLQTVYLKASQTGKYPNNEEKDWQSGYLFGWSVAVNGLGNVVAVGAPGEDGLSTGIDGDSTEIGHIWLNSGAVYVFGDPSGQWQQDAYIKASNTGESDGFGHAVSLSDSGDVLAVGAPGESSSATGIDGGQTDDLAQDAGAVYLIRSDNGSWAQEAYIKGSNTNAGDAFGGGVTLSGDGWTLAVLASLEDSDARGINQDQGNDLARQSGAAYVFQVDTGGWWQLAFVKARNAEQGDYFGNDFETPGAIALDRTGSTLAVGASREDGGGTGLTADPDDNSAEHAGAVYVF